MKGTVQRETHSESVNTTQRNGYITPEVNIYETKDGYVMEAEMPGVNKTGLEITLEGNELTITGHPAESSVPGQSVFSECRNADYKRKFELDPAIDTSKISAKMVQGILVLNLPKSELVKPRKIAVQ